MGRRSFREREGLADENLELAFAHQVETLLGALAHQLVIRRRGVEHEAADLERFLEQPEHIEFVGRAARASVQDGMAERRETADAFLEGRLADRVQDQIDAFAAGETFGFLGEVVALVVDYLVGAVLT